MIYNDKHLRAMGLGLCGAHRTGKTTIGKAIAEVNDCSFVTSSASAIAKRMGIHVDAGMPLEERLRFQEVVLHELCTMYEANNGLFVADRTPLDMAAYLLADWHPAVTTPELDEWCRQYVRRCMEATARYFFFVAVVQPGIPYVSAPGKPSPSPIYQEMLNATITGLAMQPELPCGVKILPRHLLDNGDRAKVVSDAYSQQIVRYQESLQENFSLQ